jgi:hypothetical protein
MSRLHVHVGVGDREASITFHRTLFGAEPAAAAPVGACFVPAEA